MRKIVFLSFKSDVYCTYNNYYPYRSTSLHSQTFQITLEHDQITPFTDIQIILRSTITTTKNTYYYMYNTKEKQQTDKKKHTHSRRGTHAPTTVFLKTYAIFIVMMKNIPISFISLCSDAGCSSHSLCCSSCILVTAVARRIKRYKIRGCSTAITK